MTRKEEIVLTSKQHKNSLFNNYGDVFVAGAKRADEVRKAINKNFPCINGGRCYEQSIGASGFELGVKWADNNPKSPWISSKEKLPYNNPNFIHFGFTNKVLVMDKKGNLFVAYMKKNKDNNWIWCNDIDDNFNLLSEITHWMYIPKL